MTACRAILVWCASSLLAGSATAGLDVSASVSCPDTASADSTITMDVVLENHECTSAVTVRLVTAIAGNANGTLAGVGVYGPVLANPGVTVPAATPGTCNTSLHQCSGPYPYYCNVDADCGCFTATPGTLLVNAQLAPPAVPAAHVGTVEAHLLVTEWEGTPTLGTTTLVDQCLVEVTP